MNTIIKLISYPVKWLWDLFRALVDFIWSVVRAILRSCLFIVVGFLYLIPAFIFSFDGSRNKFVFLFYLIILILPISIKGLLTKHYLVKLFSGIFIMASGFMVYQYYLSFLNIYLVTWLVIASGLLILRELLMDDDSNRILALSTSVFSAILILALSYNVFFSGDFFLKDQNPTCARLVSINDLPGISASSRELIRKTDVLIVPERVCEVQQNEYAFAARPVKNKFFSQDVYYLKSKPEDFDELVAEINYVSNFQESYIKSYAFHGGQGFVRAALDTFKFLFNILLHPIDTISSFFDFIVSIPDIVLNCFRDPSSIVASTLGALNSHMDETEQEIARQNNLKTEKIMLPETVAVIKHQRNIEFGGAVGFQAVDLYAGYRGASLVKYLPYFKNTEKAVRLNKFIKHAPDSGTNKLVRETGKEAEAQIAKGEVKQITDLQDVQNSAISRERITLNQNSLEKHPVMNKVDDGQPRSQTHPQERNTAPGQKDIKTPKGKEEFYPKAQEDLKSAGINTIPEEGLKKVGSHWKSRPDCVGYRENQLIVSEIKSGMEPPTSSSWRKAQKSDTTQFTAVRKQVKALEDAGEVSKEVGGWMIIAKGQVEDYARKMGRTWDVPNPSMKKGKKLYGSLSVPPDQKENVLTAFAELKKRKKLDIDLNKIEIIESEGSVSFIWPLGTI
ncbi:MAG TPA: hypothetical protein P5244_05305 [Syntrophales bacterium]|nr:hypothetical protein [Syntrophales bacterium]HRT27146.1 hypothetical protein [Syntrophales bacterium]